MIFNQNTEFEINNLEFHFTSSCTTSVTSSPNAFFFLAINLLLLINPFKKAVSCVRGPRRTRSMLSFGFGLHFCWDLVLTFTDLENSV